MYSKSIAGGSASLFAVTALSLVFSVLAPFVVKPLSTLLDYPAHDSFHRYMMKAEVLLYTDWEPYGGKTKTGKEKVSVSGMDLSVDLNRFSGMILNLTVNCLKAKEN